MIEVSHRRWTKGGHKRSLRTLIEQHDSEILKAVVKLSDFLKLRMAESLGFRSGKIDADAGRGEINVSQVYTNDKGVSENFTLINNTNC